MTAQHTSDYPTLGEVLRLPAFAGCIVCGGAAGLDRQVSGVNLTDTPDYARWLAQGELLITTGFAIADDPQAVDALLPTAMEKGLSGVGIKPGRYLPKPLSAELTEAADRLELPLLQLPDDVRFAELADTVSREIARRRIPTEQERQMALLLHHLVSGAPPSEAMERQAAESGIHLEYPHILLRIRADAPELQRRAWLPSRARHTTLILPPQTMKSAKSTCGSRMAVCRRCSRWRAPNSGTSRNGSTICRRKAGCVNARI